MLDLLRSTTLTAEQVGQLSTCAESGHLLLAVVNEVGGGVIGSPFLPAHRVSHADSRLEQD
jgi:hypothetical protein